jgi:Reverse transcriptase (RNA-dependent DNA polymerase)
MVLTEGWATRQVDYTNAFVQAKLTEEVYLEFPKTFALKSRANVVLKLVKSRYGLRQAPRTFFVKLCDGVLEQRYVQSKNDACLFMKEGILYIVYADDTIFAGADASVLE